MESELAGPDQASLVDLGRRLDDLWEQYLAVLDEYDSAKQDISRHMSSGFMSLATANFKSASGRRYGQDQYDGRMQASLRADTSLDIDGPKYSIERSTRPVVSEQEDGEPSTPCDPIKWFGILVPAALRTAQSDFAACFDNGHIAQAAQSARRLRLLEAEIRRVRKEIRRVERG